MKTPFSMLLVLFGAIVAPCACQIEQTDLELIQVQILSRHGLRAPEFPFPNDEYSDQPKYWPNGWGQLTALGKEQEFELGQFIRKRYGSFLSDVFSSEEVFAISSDYDRTILSAQLVLAGIYTKGNAFDIDSIIPTHSIPKSADRMINPSPNCPRRQELYTEYQKSPEVTEYKTKYKVLFDSIRQKMGYGPNQTIEMYNSIGSLMIERIYNLTLPAWAKDLLDSDDFLRIISQVFRFLTGTDTLKRLTTGPLLTNMVDNMKRKVNRTESRKLFLYKGHDITVSNMINTLSTFETWPTFSATLFFELFRNKSTKEHIVRLLYKKSMSDDLRELKLLKCSTPCTLEKFSSGYHEFLPTSDELDVECNLDQSTLSTLDAVLIGVIVGLVLVLIGFIFVTFRRQPKCAYEINNS